MIISLQWSTTVRLAQPAMARGLSKDPSKTLENPRTRYRNFSDTEIVLRVAKLTEPFAVLLASVTA